MAASLSGMGVYADGAILTFGMQLVGFGVAATFRTEIFYDVLGGINFLAIIVLSFIDNNNNNNNNAPLKVFRLLFGVSRGWLLVFLAWRAHERKGDSRFDGVRDVPSVFFVYWMVQAVWVYCVSTPLLVVTTIAGEEEEQTTTTNMESNSSLWLSNLLLVGMGLSIYFEIQSDITKAKWVSKGRPGGFCTDGFWKYSRHPNYAGEIATWGFAALYAATLDDRSSSLLFLSKNLWIALVSPLFTFNILLCTSGTGVWNAEGKNLKRYYEHSDPSVTENYIEYRRKTPPLFPTFCVPYEKIPPAVQRLVCFEWERYEYKPSSSKKKP